MIDINKKYRTFDPCFLSPVINEITDGRAYGRVGLMPTSWSSVTGVAIDTSHGVELSRLDLIEVKPEVTTRRSVCVAEGDTMAFTSAPRCESGKILGSIDITHDGEKLIKVEIVP